MKNALRGALALVALLALPGLALGQVGDGSEWTWGTDSATVNVTQNSSANDATVSYTDANGTSGTATGTLGPGSSEATPNVSAAGTGTTPTKTDPQTGEQTPGHTYKVEDGKVYRKNERGEWVRGKKKKKTTQTWGGQYLQAGEPAPKRGVLRSPGQPDVDLLVNDPAPWAGEFWSSPGDDVVSLPQVP